MLTEGKVPTPPPSCCATDEEGIRRHSAALNAGDAYRLFAGVLTQRPWEEISRQATADSRLALKYTDGQWARGGALDTSSEGGWEGWAQVTSPPTHTHSPSSPHPRACDRLRVGVGGIWATRREGSERQIEADFPPSPGMRNGEQHVRDLSPTVWMQRRGMQ